MPDNNKEPKIIDIVKFETVGWHPQLLQQIAYKAAEFPLVGAILCEPDDEDYHCPKCGDLLVISELGKVGINTKCNGADCNFVMFFFLSELI